MALTAPQQTQMAKLEAEVADLKSKFNDSVTMRSLFGNYMFDKIAAIEKAIAAVKTA